MKVHILKENPDFALEGTARWGGYWEKGEYFPGQEFYALNSSGEKIRMNTRVTAYWPDGSIKWTAHSAAAAEAGEEIEVLPGPAVQETALSCRETEDLYRVKNPYLEVEIPKDGSLLIRQAKLNGKTRLEEARAVLILEEHKKQDGECLTQEKTYYGAADEVKLEDSGPYALSFVYRGRFKNAAKEENSSFIIRLEITEDSRDLNFMHTFIYEGDENKDYLKGLGIAFKFRAAGRHYNRHVKFKGDHGVFHEISAQILPWRPKLDRAIYREQFKGDVLKTDAELAALLDKIMDDMPLWSNYSFYQDSVSHFGIKKSIDEKDVSSIACLDGFRTSGVTAFGTEAGAFVLGIKDFWQKYPMGTEIRGLTRDTGEAVLWLRTPEAEAFDFRHYAQRGYNQVYYEGYDYKGGQPQGVSNTNELCIRLEDVLIPSDEALDNFALMLQEPLIYTAAPEFYHAHQVFGFWSLPSYETESERWLEDQLEKLFCFYKQEVEQRNWYGFYNYGDFMHSYDPVRHVWKYDMGGYGWDNTELVPTLWLWLYFMRSGRADVFKLAANLSRHSSEVDVYHAGPYKGLGSRHNVSHWGCPCKEARISMAYHHRYLYYLSGDRRLEEIFTEVKDNERSLLAKDPLGDFYDKEEMKLPTHARSGPDWSSLCSNWLTYWEMTGHGSYRDKMLVGMEDIKQAPLQLVSGPDFEFDPESYHLGYIGERTTGGTHLQICMGAPQIWYEMAYILEDKEWAKMLADYGRFYYLSKEEQQKASGGIIGDRDFSLPFMASGIAAYGAHYYKDAELARTTWRILLETLIQPGNREGFALRIAENKGNHARLEEIPMISTNFAAQFGLNAICALDMIREELPETLDEIEALIGTDKEDYYYKA